MAAIFHLYIDQVGIETRTSGIVGKNSGAILVLFIAPRLAFVDDGTV